MFHFYTFPIFFKYNFFLVKNRNFYIKGINLLYILKKSFSKILKFDIIIFNILIYLINFKKTLY